MGWAITRHPDGTTTATAPDGHTLHATAHPSKPPNQRRDPAPGITGTAFGRGLTDVGEAAFHPVRRVEVHGFGMDEHVPPADPVRPNI